MIKIFNIEQYPQLQQINLGKANLEYSHHALERCERKGIKARPIITISAGTVVELEKDMRTGQNLKIIVRVQYNASQDLVLALIPRSDLPAGYLFVKTCWLNHKDDNHATLNYSRLSCPA